jgi:chorismate mutase
MVHEPQARRVSYPPPTTTAIELVDKVFDFVDIGARFRGRRILREAMHCKQQTSHRTWAITILQRDFRIRAPIATTIGLGTRITGVGMTEQQERLAKEREEIAKRVANFKATQEKFKREREEYFVTTLENARSGGGRAPFWS